MLDPSIRPIVDLRDRTLQKSRIAFTNRIAAVEQGRDEMDEASLAMLEKWQERFDALEKEADQDIADLVGDEPIVEQLIRIKGIGRLLAAKLVCSIDITKADTVSALWRYAGYGVNGDGQRERPTKGERLHYNVRLKTTCYLVAVSFLRANSPYRTVYDQARAYYLENRPEWTKAHQHQASLRKMIKVFLSHLWVVWRTMEGLETGQPYIIGKGSHTHYLHPNQFGWDIEL